MVKSMVGGGPIFGNATTKLYCNCNYNLYAQDIVCTWQYAWLSRKDATLMHVRPLADKKTNKNTKQQFT